MNSTSNYYNLLETGSPPCFRICKITIIVCRFIGNRCRVLHEQIDEELLKFIEVFIIHYDMTSQQGSQPKLLCPEYNSSVPSICIKYWFHIANQSSWINPKYIQNCTKSSWCKAWRHAASVMKSLSEILNLLIFIMLTGWALASAAMWDPSVLSESSNRPHVLIRPITGQNLNLTIILKLCLLCSSWCISMSWCQAISIYIARQI